MMYELGRRKTFPRSRDNSGPANNGQEVPTTSAKRYRKKIDVFVPDNGGRRVAPSGLMDVRPDTVNGIRGARFTPLSTEPTRRFETSRGVLGGGTSQEAQRRARRKLRKAAR